MLHATPASLDGRYAIMREGRHTADARNGFLVIDDGGVQLADRLAQLAPLARCPAVGKRIAVGGLTGVEDSSGGGARDRPWVCGVGQAGVAVRGGGTDHLESVLVQDPQRRHGARPHGQGVHRGLRGPPQLRVGLPSLADAPDPCPDVVAVVHALCRAERDELLGQPIRGGFRQPAGARQRGQPESAVGLDERVEDRECAVEHPRFAQAPDGAVIPGAHNLSISRPVRAPSK